MSLTKKHKVLSVFEISLNSLKLSVKFSETPKRNYLHPHAFKEPYFIYLVHQLDDIN